MAEFLSVPIRTVLNSTKPDHPVITVEPGMLLLEAIQVLADKKILSAPVYSKSTENPLVVGVLDYACVVKLLLSKLGSEQEPTEAQLLEAVSTLAEVKVAEGCLPVAKATDTILLHTHHLSLTLERIMPLFFTSGRLAPSNAPTPAHRLYVLSKTGRPVQSLSQTDLVKFFHSNISLLGGLAQLTVLQLGIFSKDIVHVGENDFRSKLITLPHTAPMLTALARLGPRVSSLAIVDDRGALVASVSMSNLRGFLDAWPTLLWPLSRFDHHTPAVTCTFDTTLADLLGLFVDNGVHCVYGVAEELPISIITLTDVLLAIHEYKG
eukprot:NODE_2790_length_1090_cov_29.389408_g2660_i0.p1 GENE.NODE_2790_length_1090_cov_29.389408_g2660_i0~~NODE_2790_length_1090_cov_29.389408_g2660_i0.p1  ORF type:complete len:322 (+),score=90.07 NODE_2790_length_1090_cov_29.389408_g2660_i0:69-1034(+)